MARDAHDALQLARDVVRAIQLLTRVFTSASVKLDYWTRLQDGVFFEPCATHRVVHSRAVPFSCLLDMLGSGTATRALPSI